MAQWGKTDTAADAPNYEVQDEMFFVDIEEAGVEANRAKGLKTAGWNKYTTYVDANGDTRHKVENIVAMKVAAVDAGDLGVSGNTAIEDATVSDPV